ncbi:hypothetical protein BDR26DRAFT_861354 [Obelidium mucronatum]|nr:hypothetical protein BDR26DRAFT_861354 [Obelidium mucronatum]
MAAASLLRLAERLTDSRANLAANARIANASRLSALMKAEAAFLAAAAATLGAEKQQVALASTNAPFFESVGDAAQKLSATTGAAAVLKKVGRLVVDVAVGGNNVKPVWIKIRAGTVKSARLEGDYSAGEDDDASYDGDDSEPDDMVIQQVDPQPTTPLDVSNLRIISQARDWIAAAKGNPLHFIIPQVVFCFTTACVSSLDEMDHILVNALADTGAIVLFGIASPNMSDPPNTTSLLTQVLNLDLTTLISLVSDTCHRFERIPKHVFDVDALVQQEASEAQSPLLKKRAIPHFRTRTLVTTRSAFLKFIPIASKIAGPFEKHRIRLLFDRSRMDQDLISLLDEATSMSCEATVSESEVLAWTSAGILKEKVGVVADDPSDRFLRLLSPPSSSSLQSLKSGDKTLQKIGKGPHQPFKRLKISESNADRYSWTDINRKHVSSGDQSSVEEKDGDDNGMGGVSLVLARTAKFD